VTALAIVDILEEAVVADAFARSNASITAYMAVLAD
jgi:hypothetical protein